MTAELEQLGLELTETPDRIEIRLPSRLGLGRGMLLGFLASPVVFFWLGFTTAALRDRSWGVASVALVTVVAAAAFSGLMWIARGWRSGAKVIITPDRLAVHPLLATKHERLEVHLNQVRLDEAERAIVVSAGKRKMKIGSGLKREQRHAVFEFLTGLIARHIQGVDENINQPELRDAAAEPGGALPTDALETRVLALCQQLSSVDAGNVHIAPEIPDPVLVRAAEGYLDLQDDEVLLAIVGVKKEGSPFAGCALTSKRIYWPGKRRSASFTGPSRSQSLDYVALAATITRKGVGMGIQLAPGAFVPVVGSVPMRTALVSVLTQVGSMARGETTALEPSPADLSRARWAWPRVVAGNARVLALHAQTHAYDSRTRVARRAIVTPLLTVACVAVFALMVAGGVPVEQPTTEQLYAWGANSGAAVAFNHQFWRLFTAMFLHIGALHLIMNMFCLIVSGPVIERLFGHLGFAVLYIFAGIGGFIASTVAQPAHVSAGASGAIFGIYGGLLGYLAIRHRDFPFTVLKPMLAGAIAFVAYNTYFSFVAAGIDIAAHFGGLATGFVVGLVLTLVSARDARLAWRPAPILRRTVAVAVLAAALALIGQKAIPAARTRILADPEIGPSLDAAPAYNDFYAAANPILLEFDRIADGIDKLTADIDKRGVGDAANSQTLDRLKTESNVLGEKIPTIPARNGELQAIRNRLSSAQTHQLQMLTAIGQYMTTSDPALITGPSGLNAAAGAYVGELKQTGPMRDAYIKAHKLRMINK